MPRLSPRSLTENSRCPGRFRREWGPEGAGGETRKEHRLGTSAPNGRDRWALERLATEYSAQEGIEVSDEPVRTTLKKTRLRPHLKQQWCLPRRENVGFCWHMEDVLSVYTRPFDPAHPVVCFGELPKMLYAHSRSPRPGGLTPLRRHWQLDLTVARAPGRSRNEATSR